MAKTTWTEERLQRQFNRYNSRYWHEGLPKYRICISGMILGQLREGKCDSSARKILINVESHSTDREIRQTLLHEMAHAAVPRGVDLHDFLAELRSRVEALTQPLPACPHHATVPSFVPHLNRKPSQMVLQG